MNFDNQTIILVGIIIFLFLLINNQNKKVCEGLPEEDPLFYCADPTYNGDYRCPDVSSSGTLAADPQSGITGENCFRKGGRGGNCTHAYLKDHTGTDLINKYQECYASICSQELQHQGNNRIPEPCTTQGLIPNTYQEWENSGNQGVRHQGFKLCKAPPLPTPPPPSGH